MFINHTILAFDTELSPPNLSSRWPKKEIKTLALTDINNTLLPGSFVWPPNTI